MPFHLPPALSTAILCMPSYLCYVGQSVPYRPMLEYCSTQNLIRLFRLQNVKVSRHNTWRFREEVECWIAELSTTRASRTLHSRKFRGLISVRDWMDPTGNRARDLPCYGQCLNQLRHHPLGIMVVILHISSGILKELEKLTRKYKCWLCDMWLCSWWRSC